MSAANQNGSTEFDYIVIGGGSAGCVVTHRLVSAGHRVLLLEAGPPDNSFFVHTPATFVRVIGTKRTWFTRPSRKRTRPAAGCTCRRAARSAAAAR